MLKKTKRLIVAILIFSMAFAYGSVPKTNAAALTSASDTISDSDLNVVANHTVAFTTTTAIAATGYIDIAFQSDFGAIADTADITCPAGGAASTSTPKTARCTFAGGSVTGAKTVTINNIQNPGVANSYTVVITTYDAPATQLDTATVRVAVISDVQVSASVPTTLNFTIGDVNSGQSVNGDTTTGTSTATEINYNTLASGTPEVIAQSLSVTTNASAGFSVTVQQSANLSNGTADIDAFSTTSPSAWAVPVPTLGNESTYGHFAITSQDSNLTGATDPFGAQLYQGFNGTTPLEVMYNGGSADGTTDNIGSTKVGYKIQITDLQEAGDYTNSLTYICTPTY